MKIVVLKFGGTSVGTVDRIKKVANIIVGYVRKGFRVIVVSSAMSGATNDLIKKSRNISNNFNSSEYDVLVAAGEQMACALIAGRLNHIGYKSQSWMSWQVPILTEGEHKSSRISNINKNYELATYFKKIDEFIKYETCDFYVPLNIYNKNKQTKNNLISLRINNNLSASQNRQLKCWL